MAGILKRQDRGHEMSIYRVRSGLIFDDQFTSLNTERWTISPSGSYSLPGNGLSLRHSVVGETVAMFQLPVEEEELLFEVKASYTPVRTGDEGGLVVWKSAQEKLEFLESIDSTTATEYSNWRISRKGNLFTFFAERNGAWELFDSSVCLEPVRAGLVLKGENDTGFTPLLARRAILCKGSHITVANVNSGYVIKLLNEQGREVRAQEVPTGFSGIKLELPSIPFRGKIQVSDIDPVTGRINTVYEMKELVDMYGGDEFLTGTELVVYWNGEKLDQYVPTHLGAIKSGTLIEKMTIANPSSGSVAEQIKIRIAKYEESFGWEWTELADDVNGHPGEFTREVTIGTLNPNQSRDFWMRIERKDFMGSNQPTYFLLDIENE